MNRRPVLLLMLALSSSAFAQVFEWADVKPINLSTNPGFLRYTLTLDTSGNPVYARLLRSNLIYGPAYYGDQIIEKLDGAGNSLFADTLFGKVYIEDITVDRSNNIIVTGLFRDTMRVDTALRTLPPAAIPNCFMVKLRPDGSLVWLRNLTQAHPTWMGIRSLRVDDDNNFWGTVETSTLSTFVEKLDGNGNELASFEQAGVRVISGLALDRDRNVWVTGSTFSGPQSFNGLAVTAPFNYDMYIVRYSPAGVASWVRFVEDITLQSPRVATLGTGAIMSGNLFDSTAFGQLIAHGPQWAYDLFVTNIDSAGNFNWLSEIPLGNVQGDAYTGEGPFVTTFGDTSVLVTGLARGTVHWGNGVVTAARGYTDVLVLNYSADGNVRWAKTAGGGNGSGRGDAVAVDRQGNTYVAGMVGPGAMFDSVQYGGSNVNSFIARITPGGLTTVSNETAPAAFVLYQNYPNPFNPSTNVEFRVMSAEFVTLKVYNLLGQEVATLVSEVKPPGEYTVQWDARRQASGVYLYRLQARPIDGGQAGESVQTKRLVLLR